jgi:TRAP-type mannitol/chloroaromatic compound transport system permease small subunit
MEVMVKSKLNIKLNKFRETEWLLLDKIMLMKRELYSLDMEKRLKLSISRLYKNQVKRETKLLKSNSPTLLLKVLNLVKKISIW